MLKEHQSPLGIDEQIENLKEIGLTVENDQEIRQFLNDVSYFRIIKGYSLGLKDKSSGKYLKGVTFSQIKQLYFFNAKFRYLILPEIEKVEINLRCRISNYFSLKYGVFGYENADNFTNAEYHAQFLNDIKLEVERNKKSPFVKNYLNNYEGNKLPFYAVVELLSFGALSKFFKNMKSADKKSIAMLYGVTYNYFESWIEHLAFVRNICAHYGRLYNVNLPKTPILYDQYNKLKISNLRVYATLICLKHLLPNNKHWEKFVARIAELLDSYPAVNKTFMGFPNEGDAWGNILLLPLSDLN